jgi:crotonobetainyl-CoA:carnitine CoA-transferase CaiB-like acyl-CoA transferase
MRAPALEGLLVVELAPSLPGQLTCMVLGDLGARVVKVERPEGDPARHRAHGRFEAVNRNKESLVLDLKAEAGRERLRRLTDCADVLIEGFRPGVAARLGVGPEALTAANPRLVYCSISGYGQTGPLRDLPGHEKNFLGLSGVLSTIGEPDRPEARIGVSIADVVAALAAATAVLAALRARERDGRGQVVDLALADACYLLATTRLFDALVGGVDPTAAYDRPGMGVFGAADGRLLTLAAAGDEERDRLFALTGPDIAAGIRTAPRDEWLRRLSEAGISSGPLNDLREAAAEPQAQARGILRWLETDAGRLPQVLFPALLSETPAAIRRPPPRLDEHDPDLEES